jgi:hypothetical protein
VSGTRIPPGYPPWDGRNAFSVDGGPALDAKKNRLHCDRRKMIGDSITASLGANINYRSAFSDACTTGVWKAPDAMRLARFKATSMATLSVSKIPSPAAALGLNSV